MDVLEADRAVEDLNAKADDARKVAQAARDKAFIDSQTRADVAEAKKPMWQTIHETLYDKTERLILEGGYLLRSSWRHAQGVYRGDPLVGSSVVFVAGEAAPLANATTLVLTPADLFPGVNPYGATLADVHPIRQLDTAGEVILFLPDGRVRVLRSRAEPGSVGQIRAALPTDGPVPDGVTPDPVPEPETPPVTPIHDSVET